MLKTKGKALMKVEEYEKKIKTLEDRLNKMTIKYIKERNKNQK